MAKPEAKFFKAGSGILPKQVGADEATAGIKASSFEGTLFVVHTNSIGGGLALKVQDSADGSSWADVAGGSLAATATSVHLIWVRHTSVREYVRVHAAGTTNPVASIVPIQLNDAMGPGGSVDISL